VDLRDAGSTRRWQSVIASIGALSLFVALIAGSALRPQFAAATLPEPVAWSSGALDVGAHAARVQLYGRFQPASYVVRDSSLGSSPMNKKPFHSMWMTRDRPAAWTRVSPLWIRSALSYSLRSLDSRAPVARRDPSSDLLTDHDILTQLCVARC